jgi:hypothetical protein
MFGAGRMGTLLQYRGLLSLGAALFTHLARLSDLIGKPP